MTSRIQCLAWDFGDTLCDERCKHITFFEYTYAWVALARYGWQQPYFVNTAKRLCSSTR